MTKKTRVLITGACGFLGQFALRLFLNNNYHVFALDLPDTSQLLASDIAANDYFQFIGANLLDENLSSLLPHDMDYVVHLGGLASVRDSFDHPADYHNVNVNGTINLLKVCMYLSICKFIFASSAAVYGPNSTDTMAESEPLNPSNPYAKSKVDAEHHIEHLGKKYGFDTVILRFFNIYGPGQKLDGPGIVPAFIRSMHIDNKIEIFGDGKRTRSFIHAQDCAEAILLSCTELTGSSVVLNICAESSTSIQEVAEILIQSSGRDDIQIDNIPLDMKPAEKSGCSGKLAKSLLGFTPEISIRTGLKETYNSFVSVDSSK